MDMITGSQGAGKTYYAVNYLFENQAKYHICITNLFLKEDSFQIKFVGFDYNKIDSIFLQLHNAYMEGTQDKELLKLFKGYMESYYNVDIEVGSNVLIILDEAHNYLSKKNEIRTFLVTYHRHFNIDFIAITQNSNLIHSDNRIVNQLIYAYPISKQVFFRRLRYGVFGDVHAKGDPISRFTLKKKDDIYNLYQSGGKLSNKESPLKGKIILLVLLALFLIFFFYRLVSSYTTPSSPPPTPPVSPTPPSSPVSSLASKRNIGGANNFILTHARQIDCNVNILDTPIKDIDCLDFPFYVNMFDIQILRRKNDCCSTDLTILINRDKLLKSYPDYYKRGDGNVSI
jgi:hypothetical protein